MSSDKPINAMYGSKMKLNLDKLKKNRKKDDEEIETKSVEKVEKTVVDETVVENVHEDVIGESIEESLVMEETDEEIVDKKIIDGKIPEKPVEKTFNEKSSKKIDSNILDSLKTKLNEKEKKLSNQSSELNYLTNKIIPNLKKENAKLNSLKIELTDALDKSTRKYFDQLDINADLSNQIGKLGAEGAVNKVRAEKFEAEIKSIKEELQTKIDHYKEKIDSINIDELKKENNNLSIELSDVKSELDKTKKENIKLSDEVKTLREELIEIGNYKEEVDNQNKEAIEGYKEEISSLTTKLKLKESSYDKLSNESNKTISDLRKQVAKLEEDLEKESNKGLFNRFK